MILSTEAAQIQEDEGGDVAQTYLDTLGNGTGGVGHKLTPEELAKYPVGTTIPKTVRDRWFREDMEIAFRDASKLLNHEIPHEAFNIVVNMAFNMGRGRLAGFAGMRKALREEDYNRAADEMEWQDPDDRSKGHTPWFTQTGGRAKRLVVRMRKVSNG